MQLKKIIQVLTGILLVIYPFAIYLALRYDKFNLAILGLLVIFVLRLLLSTSHIKQLAWFAKYLAIFGIAMVVLSWLLGQYEILLYYPVATNALLLCLFASSLYQSSTIIERLARIKHPNLNQDAIIYTRKVTICWCIFFVINGLIALITCLLDDVYWWTLYNGAISYILIGLLMGIEWLIRRRVQTKV